MAMHNVSPFGLLQVQNVLIEVIGLLIQTIRRALRAIMEWIYSQTKMRGQGSLELAQETKKKERKIEKWPFFSNIWFLARNYPARMRKG